MVLTVSQEQWEMLLNDDITFKQINMKCTPREWYAAAVARRKRVRRRGVVRRSGGEGLKQGGVQQRKRWRAGVLHRCGPRPCQGLKQGSIHQRKRWRGAVLHRSGPRPCQAAKKRIPAPSYAMVEPGMVTWEDVNGRWKRRTIPHCDRGPSVAPEEDFDATDDYCSNCFFWFLTDGCSHHPHANIHGCIV